MHFKKKDGTIYPLSKIEIYQNIDVYNPSSFQYLLKELDIPWIPKYWNIYLEQSIKLNHNISSTFGKYYNCMWLRGFRDFGYEDSYKFKDL